MTDETETEEGGEVEAEWDSGAEYVNTANAIIIAPHGWGFLADCVEAETGVMILAHRISFSGNGSVEFLTYEESGIQWRKVEQMNATKSNKTSPTVVNITSKGKS